ncbi:MAG TPA: type I phosphomannose isomerase catalytic subunit [Bacteroidales bacterium]|nr:type I phosphomannose isomerase catalytic subunit [Bacteroidales bacterium]
MAELYPLKFDSILKERVWGGHSLSERFNKKTGKQGKIGESWEISAVYDNISVVSNGFLQGNNLEELIEVYMGDLIGDAIYEKFGKEFPLLIKLIEAKQDLSIQVHPENELAKKRHKAYGKTEMWYILESDNARIYSGFKDDVTKESYIEAIKDGSVASLLNVETAKAGDAFFTPAGRVHSIGGGIVLIEIQQTSDITYRIFDWNRTGKEQRELHTDLALDAIDFNAKGESVIRKEPILNKNVNLASCEFFSTDLLRFNKLIKKEYYLLDSFVIYICIDGDFTITCDEYSEHVKKGETVLVPAMLKEVMLNPAGETQLLEIYINEKINIL